MIGVPSMIIMTGCGLAVGWRADGGITDAAALSVHRFTTAET